MSPNSSCDRLLETKEYNLQLEAILKEKFPYIFYAFINISRRRLGRLHRSFTMKQRIKIKEDMIKGNLLFIQKQGSTTPAGPNGKQKKS